MAFRLERVARLHEQLRRLRQLEVEAESSALARCRDALSEHRRRRSAAIEEERARAEAGGIAAREIQLWRAYADGLLALEGRLREQEAAQGAALEESRARLRGQRTQERRFSHLEERWRQREEAARAEREQRAVDELVMRRAAQKG